LQSIAREDRDWIGVGDIDQLLRPLSAAAVAAVVLLERGGAVAWRCGDCRQGR
jgi:hypothetical protein